MAAVLLLTMSLWCWLKPIDKQSESERRLLAVFPEISADAIFSGEFMSDFELYSQDQFPLRDSFRSIKALASRFVFTNLDNNALYFSQGHLSKIEYPYNHAMLQHAADRFTNVFESYLVDTDCKVYLSIIPDKNCFLAKPSHRLSLEYENFYREFRALVPYMEYIDISGMLSISDYYRTDSHWRQERIVPVAEALLNGMGATLPENISYSESSLPIPFYGVYYGQAALPAEPDTINYLSNDILSGCIVTSYDTGTPKPSAIYDFSALESPDPYDFFLSGADAIITIDNPACETDRELVIFRDSFGSSIAPLMVSAYSRITLVDLRYVNQAFLGNYIDFKDQDVLFLYSTMLLNNSLSIK